MIEHMDGPDAAREQADDMMNEAANATASMSDERLLDIFGAFTDLASEANGNGDEFRAMLGAFASTTVAELIARRMELRKPTL